MTVIYVIIS